MSELSNGYALDDDFVKIFDGNEITTYGKCHAAVASRFSLDFKGSLFSEGREFDGWIPGRDGKRLPLKGIEIGFPISRTNTRIEQSADKTAARLLLTDVDGLDFVLWEDALLGFTIDDDGEVHLANEAIQKWLKTTIEHTI